MQLYGYNHKHSKQGGGVVVVSRGLSPVVLCPVQTANSGVSSQTLIHLNSLIEVIGGYLHEHFIGSGPKFIITNSVSGLSPEYIKDPVLIYEPP